MSIKYLDDIMELLTSEKVRIAEYIDFTIPGTLNADVFTAFVWMTILICIFHLVLGLFHRDPALNYPEQSSYMTDDPSYSKDECEDEMTMDDDDNSFLTEDEDECGNFQGDPAAAEGELPSIESSENIPRQVLEASDVDIVGCSPQFCATKGGCTLCKENLSEGNTFSSVANQKTWPIKCNYSCKTKNCIYLITCLYHFGRISSWKLLVNSFK